MQLFNTARDFICDHPLSWYDSLTTTANLNDQERIALLDRYMTFPRSYHSLHHIGYLWQLNMFMCFDNDIIFSDNEQQKLARAIAYHDCVYNPESTTNEEDSAKVYIDQFQEDWVSNAIIQSKTHFARRDISTSWDVLTEWFIGLDLASLAAPWNLFRANSLMIRSEYYHLSESEWKLGRKSFLQTALASRPIYQHSLFERYFEDRAINNLEQDLAELQ